MHSIFIHFLNKVWHVVELRLLVLQCAPYWDRFYQVFISYINVHYCYIHLWQFHYLYDGIGIGVGFAVVAGGLAVVNAFASGAVVTLVTAVIAFIGIRLVIRCLR